MFRLNYTENAGIVTLSLTTPEMKLSINSFELLATSKDIHSYTHVVLKHPKFPTAVQYARILLFRYEKRILVY